MLIATSKLADRALDWAVGSIVYPEDTQVLEPDAMELVWGHLATVAEREAA